MNQSEFGQLLNAMLTNKLKAGSNITITEVIEDGVKKYQIASTTSLPVLTANKVLISDGDGDIAVSSISDTELEYLSGISSSIKDMLLTGWVPVSETLTRTGNNTVTIPGDVTSEYRAKDKFKLTQDSTVKYGFFTKVSYSAGTNLTTINTSLESTITAEDPITNVYVSKSSNPVGFPYSMALLWIGSWNTGDITVTGSTAYQMIRVHVDSTNIDMDIMKTDGATTIHGVGGFYSTTNKGATVHFSGSYSDDVWTWTGEGRIYHTPSGSHSTEVSTPISKIWGVI